MPSALTAAKLGRSVDKENGFGIRFLPLTTLLKTFEADVYDMSKVLKIWARKILFGTKPERELPADPLPGLSLPRPMPKPPIPYQHPQAKTNEESLDEAYERFIASGGKSKKPVKSKTNWLDSMRGSREL